MLIHASSESQPDVIDTASHSSDTLKIIVGGAPFDLISDLWEELGADGCAHSTAEAVELANRLIP